MRVAGSGRFRGRWAMAASVLVLVAVAVGAGTAARSDAAAAQPRVVEAGSVCLTELTPERLGTLFDTEPGGVVGADYQRALTLPDGRVFWTFQDAAIRLGPDEITIVHNIAVVQDGVCFTVLYGGSRAQPQPFLFSSRTVPYERWFWPMDATVAADGAIHVFVAELEERGDEYLTHSVPLATWVAVVDPTTLAVTAERGAPDSSAELYGWSITSDDEWTYLYAHCFRQFGFDDHLGIAAFDRSCATEITVARVPRGRVTETPSYWDGSRWQEDAGRAVPVIDQADRRINADQIEWTGARFVSVNQEGDWWGDTVLLSESQHPTGPFEVYDTMSARPKCAECNTFFANWVPAGAVGRTDRTFVISLAHNRWDGRITSLYRPSFHRVSAPRFLPAGATFRFDVGLDVGAALLNVVAVEPTAPGYLTLYPCDGGMPTTSNLNHVDEPLVSNLVVVRPGSDGRVCVFSKATTDVVVDLVGTFAPSGGFAPVETGVRLVDTRETAGGAPVESGGVLRVDVPGEMASHAAVVNVVAVGHEAPGYLTVFPCDEQRPGTSTVNYVSEPIVSNLVISETDDAGGLCVFTLARTHVVVDLVGGFGSDEGHFVATHDVRLVDTRLDDTPARVEAGGTLIVETPTSGRAVVVNVVAVEPSSPGYLTVYPCDRGRPDTSNLNYVTAPIVANLVVVPPSTDGRICLYSSAATDVVVDLVGELASDSGFTPAPEPLRIVDSRVGAGLPGELGTPIGLPAG
ncbi:MAG: hypothetical protein HKN41_02440 [Ilumatobacter sp.]|nr:hypothetical protein [Ilumatobacter sp.]